MNQVIGLINATVLSIPCWLAIVYTLRIFL
ncbi:hypothetical protein JOE21_002004 [Desmospora profundinema]|uniref:Uncharacterized protein n=1 Tax=Desmospora profundinema TaxID=1571184 RepID=A0ABU1IMN2_9BACL|nr:hypothetical protein [Desmospora profundinema]